MQPATTSTSPPPDEQSSNETSKFSLDSGSQKQELDRLRPPTAFAKCFNLYHNHQQLPDQTKQSVSLQPNKSSDLYNEEPSQPSGQQNQAQRTSGDNKSKRNPFCSRCRNHGKSAQVKGHKRHCEYRDCLCKGCKLVKARQMISAAQIKQRRDQKQDEECGRQIEISPPVLAREPAGDPVSFMAKSLLDTPKDVQQQVSATSAAVAAATAAVAASSHGQDLPEANHHEVRTNSQHHLHQHSHRPSSIQNLPMGHCFLGSAGNTISNHQVAGLNQHHHLSTGPQSMNHHHLQHHMNQATSLNVPSLSHNRHPQHHLNLNSATQHMSAHQPGAIPASAFNKALNLFHLPNFIFPAGAGFPSMDHNSVNAQTAAAAAAMAAATAVSSSSLASNATHFDQRLTIAPVDDTTNQETNQSPKVANNQMPSVCEQIAIVEQIYRAFGPLAIYAWLKVERFDLNKVRDAIEISRASYIRLLDSKSGLLNYQNHNNGNENIDNHTINFFSNT